MIRKAASSRNVSWQILSLVSLMTLNVSASPILAVENNHSLAVQDRTVLVNPQQFNEELLKEWRARNYNIALLVVEADEKTVRAAQGIKKLAGRVDYFFEVARNTQMAKEHPEWMASIQGHHEWMRMFQGQSKPQKGEVVKVQPWVPVFNREPLNAHVTRIETLLNRLPEARRIWLNDIQGAPSACGCGHPLCRWTTDYGPIKTATPIGDAAPAEFVRKIKKISGNSQVIPIMTSECEAEDQHTVCGGVGCFKGICWKAFTRQLDKVAKENRHIGVACFYKAFQRDLPRYKEKAGWIRYALNSFEKMPKARKGTGVKVNRLVAVIQGWEVTAEEIQQQILVAEKTKPAGILLCLAPIDQSWKPQVIPIEKLQNRK